MISWGGRHRVKHKFIIKVDLREVVCEGMDQIKLVQYTLQ